MKFVIPTYDRYNRFETLYFLKNNNISLEDIFIFVADENEKMKYINSFGNDYNFIVGVLGLVNQRNFIINYFDEGEILVCIDDDIEDLIHKDNKPFIDWIDECIEYLRNSSCGLLSINPSVNPFFFEQRKNGDAFKEGNYSAIGAFHILKNDKELLLSIDDMEDWERSLLYFKKYGSNIRYNDILIKTKYFHKKGGLSSFRNKYTYLNNINKLIYNFSEYVSFTYKSLPLDKHMMFPNLKFIRKNHCIPDVIQLPKIEPSELSCLYGMLENIYITKRGMKSNRRGFPMGHRSVTFGYTRGRFNGIFGLSKYSVKHPEIYDELLRIGNIYCPFKFNSIHINKNVICPPHKDSKNIGNSMLLSFGDYIGCNIVINDKIYNANCNPVIFNGSELEHWNTDDLVGTKYSLVYFNCSFG
jgi:hypothetical protein